MGIFFLLLQAAKHLQIDYLVWISYLNYPNGCTAMDYDTKASYSLPTWTRVHTEPLVPDG
jgi:hypothetical protein